MLSDLCFKQLLSVSSSKLGEVNNYNINCEVCVCVGGDCNTFSQLKPVYSGGKGETASTMLIEQKRGTCSPVSIKTMRSSEAGIQPVALCHAVAHTRRGDSPRSGDSHKDDGQPHLKQQILHLCGCYATALQKKKNGGVGSDGGTNELLQGRVSQCVLAVWANGQAWSWLCFVLLGQQRGVKQDGGFMWLHVAAFSAWLTKQLQMEVHGWLMFVFRRPTKR